MSQTIPTRLGAIHYKEKQMSSLARVVLGNGKRWGIGSFVFSKADIIIPTDELEGMSDEEIGGYVRTLVPNAELGNAIEIAGWVSGNIDSVGNAMQFKDDIDFLGKFKGKSEEVDRALRLVEAWEEIIRDIEIKREKNRQPTKSLRKQIIERDKGMCRYCGSIIEGTPHIDHVIPYSMGGLTRIDNLVCACPKCNSIKCAKTPEEAGMVLLEVVA